MDIYVLLSESKLIAKKAHRCVWCGEQIEIGEKYVREKYVREKFVYDFAIQNMTWHEECRDDQIKNFDPANPGSTLYGEKRPERIE